MILRCDMSTEFAEPLGDCLEPYTPARAMRIIGNFLWGMPREMDIAIYLDSVKVPICAMIVGYGNVSQVPFNIPQIVQGALLSNASYVINVHNHPEFARAKNIKTSLAASKDDVAATSRLMRGLNLLGIQLLDSIIVNGVLDQKRWEPAFYSMRQHDMFRLTKTAIVRRSLLDPRPTLVGMTENERKLPFDNQLQDSAERVFGTEPSAEVDMVRVAYTPEEFAMQMKKFRDEAGIPTPEGTERFIPKANMVDEKHGLPIEKGVLISKEKVPESEQLTSFASEERD